MKESFLQACWKYKLLEINNLTTTVGEKVIVHEVGKQNTDEGPDFLHAKIEIEGKIWFGSVEIHLKNSDWKKHQHDLNKNYNTVILHLVYKMDEDENHNNIPTIELEKFIPQSIIQLTQHWLDSSKGFIPCENNLLKIEPTSKILFLESLYFKKLEEKTLILNRELKENLYHWESIFFKNLALSFGQKINANAFYNLAASIPFILIEKASQKKVDLEALLMGMAGFLDETKNSDEYIQSLKNTFEYYRHKHQLTPINNEQFKFFRLRPSSFPSIKIAQLSSIYSSRKNIFSKLMEINTLNDFYDFFSNISIQSYWDSHYVLGKKSSTIKKPITKASIDLLLINTIIPFKFAYQRLMKNESIDNLVDILSQIKPESNSIIKKFIELKIIPEDAIQSQALLYLKKNYCDQKKCFDCTFGLEILKKSIN